MEASTTCGRQLLRLICILVTNGLIFVYGVFLFFPSHDWIQTDTEHVIWLSLGCMLCFWSALGMATEVLSNSWARRINIILPSAIAALMFSTPLWLPRLGERQGYGSDAGEATWFYIVFAIIPTFFAAWNFWLYRRR